MQPNDILVVGGKYTVAAFRKADGVLIWKMILIDRFWKLGGPFVSLTVDETGVYAHSARELFRLDLQTGRVLWQQKVPELGTEIASLGMIGGTGSGLTTGAGQIQLQKKKSDSTASTDAGSSAST